MKNRKLSKRESALLLESMYNITSGEGARYGQL